MNLQALQRNLQQPLSALKEQIEGSPLFVDRNDDDIETFPANVRALIRYCESIIYWSLSEQSIPATLVACAARVDNAREILRDLSADCDKMQKQEQNNDDPQAAVEKNFFQFVFDKVEDLYRQAICPFLDDIRAVKFLTPSLMEQGETRNSYNHHAALVESLRIYADTKQIWEERTNLKPYQREYCELFDRISLRLKPKITELQQYLSFNNCHPSQWINEFLSKLTQSMHHGPGEGYGTIWDKGTMINFLDRGTGFDLPAIRIVPKLAEELACNWQAWSKPKSQAMSLVGQLLIMKAVIREHVQSATTEA